MFDGLKSNEITANGMACVRFVGLEKQQRILERHWLFRVRWQDTAFSKATMSPLLFQKPPFTGSIDPDRAADIVGSTKAVSCHRTLNKLRLLKRRASICGKVLFCFCEKAGIQ